MYGAGMDALIEDTAEVTRMLKEEWQGVPLILLGHSMVLWWFAVLQKNTMIS